jgi:ferritin
MLSKKIETALNDQIAKEANASGSYLSMASWCQTKGLGGATSFFYAQSEEEREHMLKLVKYVNESGGHARVPALKEPPAKYKNIANVFEVSLEQEKAVTKSIHKLVDLTFSAKDYATFNFLQWYVAEQHEEETLFNSILDLINIAGIEGRNLLLVDKEIASIRDKG